jgi:hypothetical protein
MLSAGRRDLADSGELTAVLIRCEGNPPGRFAKISFDGTDTDDEELAKKVPNLVGEF